MTPDVGYLAAPAAELKSNVTPLTVNASAYPSALERTAVTMAVAVIVGPVLSQMRALRALANANPSVP